MDTSTSTTADTLARRISDALAAERQAAYLRGRFTGGAANVDLADISEANEAASVASVTMWQTFYDYASQGA